MIITLFLLPALGILPVSFGAVVPHELSSKYNTGVEKHVLLDPRNRPPADFVPEDSPHAVNLAATDGPGEPGGEGDEECEDDEDEQNPLPPAEVNLAATDGYVQFSGEQGDEECNDDEDGENTTPPEVNLAATDGPGQSGDGDGEGDEDEECDDHEGEPIGPPAEVNLAATDGPGQPGDGEGEEECDDDEDEQTGQSSEVNLAATDGPLDDDEECHDDESDGPPAEVNLAAAGPPTDGPSALGSNIAVEQPAESGGVAVSVPVINNPGAGGENGGEESHEATNSTNSTSDAPKTDIATEVNNVAVGQDRDGAGMDVGVPAGNTQPNSAPHDQPKPQEGAPATDKPEDAKPQDDKPKDESKPEAGNDNTNTNTDGDIHVGTGWDISKNNADLSTWIDNGLEWFYQWTLEPTFKDVKAEFIPMVWGPDHVPKVKDAMSRWPENVKHVLSFNEPDIKDGQAGQYLKDTKQAAELHNQVSDTLGDKYQLSTPAVATGPDWLEEWEKECIGLIGKPCRSDFIAYHYYGKKPDELIDTIKKLHERFGKKVWMTEYGCFDFPNNISCSIEEADNLMKTTVEWFRANPDIVERWAWFGAFGDMTNWQGKYNMDSNRIANADGTVSDKGKKYLSM